LRISTLIAHFSDISYLQPSSILYIGKIQNPKTIQIISGRMPVFFDPKYWVVYLIQRKELGHLPGRTKFKLGEIYHAK